MWFRASTVTVAETEGSKPEDDVLWPCEVSKWYGKGYVVGMRRGKTKRGRPRKKWMEEIHTMSGMNLAELRDAVEVRDVWRKLTISIARTLRVEGTR